MTIKDFIRVVKANICGDGYDADGRCNEIIAAFLDEHKIVKCGSCKFRYNSECPLCRVEETYDEDDGHDYFYTYGESEDDNFFCARGEELL